jgi:ribosomal protein S18 acetylase RimI-like enzyme
MERTVEITTPTEASWAEFRALRLRALAEEPQAFGQTHDVACTFPETFWRGRLRDAAAGASWLICARMSGRLVGMVGAFQTDEDHRHGRATVVGTYVEPEVRRQGIAQRLLAALLDRLAAAEGVAVARLGANPEQAAAVNLYRRAGFRIIGTEIVVLGDGCSHPVLVMEKPIP